MREFKTEDLKPGMLVKLYNGSWGILIPINDTLEIYNEELQAVCSPILYTEELCDLDRQYSVTKVFDLCRAYDLFDINFRVLLWEYREPKEMTLKEIEEILGYNIKIV